MKTFLQFLAEKDNRGGKRTISLTSPMTLSPAKPAGPLRPSNVMPLPKPITGKSNSPYPVKRPPNTTLNVSK